MKVVLLRSYYMYVSVKLLGIVVLIKIIYQKKYNVFKLLIPICNFHLENKTKQNMDWSFF